MKMKLKYVLEFINIYDKIVLGVDKHNLVHYENKECIEEKYLDCIVDCVGSFSAGGLLIDIWVNE
jgi:hypothetical protein